MTLAMSNDDDAVNAEIAFDWVSKLMYAIRDVQLDICIGTRRYL